MIAAVRVGAGHRTFCAPNRNVSEPLWLQRRVTGWKCACSVLIVAVSFTLCQNSLSFNKVTVLYYFHHFLNKILVLYTLRSIHLGGN